MKKIIILFSMLLAFQSAYADTCKKIKIDINEKGNILFNAEKCITEKAYDNMYKHILDVELINAKKNNMPDLADKIELLLLREESIKDLKQSIYSFRILHDEYGPFTTGNRIVLKPKNKNITYLYEVLDNKTYIKVEKYRPEITLKYTDNIHETGNSVEINEYFLPKAKFDDVYSFVMKHLYLLTYLMKDSDEYKSVYPEAVKIMKSDFYNKTNYSIPIFDERYKINIQKTEEKIMIDTGGNFNIYIIKAETGTKILFSSGTVFYQVFFNF